METDFSHFFHHKPGIWDAGTRSVKQDGNEYTYFAQQSHIVDNLKPYHWYKKLVILGAQYFIFPDSYISSIEAVESMQDHDPKRRKENEILVENIINYR